MTTAELIKAFNLEAEVENFVKNRVAELAKEKHIFHFEGSDGTNYCEIREPHIPHVRSVYDTVRYGTLEKFCVGKEGAVKDGELVIVVTRRSLGDAYTPSRVSGYWFIRRE